MAERIARSPWLSQRLPLPTPKYGFGHLTRYIAAG